AARTFGVPGRPTGHELYYIIGLRNLWLAALAIGLAALRQWHGLALWFATGSLVCFADALIAANATGKVPQVAFHLVCGLLCILLPTIVWRGAGKGPGDERNFAALDPLGIVLKTGDKRKITPYKGAATISPPPFGAR